MTTNPKIYQIPLYEEKFTLSKKNKYCVIVFVINEGDKIIKQLSKMNQANLNVDIIVSDGGSVDGSMKKSMLQKLGVNTLLIKKDKGKLGSQMRIGLSWAMEKKYEGVIIIDGNNKDDIQKIDNFLSMLQMGYDHIQGSRFINGGKSINTPLTRLYALKLIHIPMINFFSGFNYSDTTNGFRAYSRKLILSDKISIFRKEFTNYELHYYIAIQAAKKKFKCIEIPVTRKYPKGKVPTKISPFFGNISIIIQLIKVCFGLYNVKD